LASSFARCRRQQVASRFAPQNVVPRNRFGFEGRIRLTAGEALHAQGAAKPPNIFVQPDRETVQRKNSFTRWRFGGLVHFTLWNSIEEIASIGVKTGLSISSDNIAGR